jgi:hypothetical protein
VLDMRQSEVPAYGLADRMRFAVASHASGTIGCRKPPGFESSASACPISVILSIKVRSTRADITFW